MTETTITSTATGSSIDAPASTQAACCGGPAPAGTDACCVHDAEVKTAGGAGCGCGSTHAAPVGKKTACCG